MMTKTLSLLSALLLVAAASHAQTASIAPVGLDPKTGQAVTAMTREMSNRLYLNEGQYIKLYSINRTRLTRQQEIEHATASDASARTAQLAELQGQYEQECARILTPSQLSLLQQDQTNPATIGNGQG
jgi:Spy/CpxP family protein refolding chaperone